MDDTQRSSSPKSKWRLVIDRDACAALTRKFATDLSLQIFFELTIYHGKVEMKHSSRQFGEQFSGFGHQS